MKRGKRGISWYIFVKILVKRAKTGIERKGICTVLAVQSMVLCRSTAQNYPIDYHNLTNKHHPFPNNFQKPDPVIIGHGHFRSFSFSGGANLPYKYYINIFIYTIDPNDRIIFENDRKWPWPKMTAFKTSKKRFKRRFLQSDVKTTNTYILKYQLLTHYFQTFYGKKLAFWLEFLYLCTGNRKNSLLVPKVGHLWRPRLVLIDGRRRSSMKTTKWAGNGFLGNCDSRNS